jgi:hypothetical protein
MHGSRRPNHLASSSLDSRGEIESDKRLVFDNQYRDLIQQRISPRGNVAPMAVVCQHLGVAEEQSLSVRDVPSVSK